MKGKAIAGLILGIVAIACGFNLIPFSALVGLPAAIVGLVLSAGAGKKLKAAGQPSGVATAGLVIGIIAVVWTAISFVSCGLCSLCAAGAAAAL